MYRPSSRKAVSPTNSEGPSEAWIFGSLCDQGVQIDPEGDHERPEHNRRQAFQNVAGNVPCHEIAVGGGDHYPDDQIHNPDQTYSAPAHFAPAISAYHRSSATAGCVSNHSSAGVIRGGRGSFRFDLPRAVRAQCRVRTKRVSLVHNDGMRTFGVEEELLIVDPADGRLLPLAGELLAVSRTAAGTSSALGDPVLAVEFKQEQIEVQTSPCSSLDGLLEEIRRGRDAADAAARAVGARVAALATSPRPTVMHTTRGPRYAAMMDGFGLTAREQLTCGLHVHVSVGSDEEGVAVLDRIRIWLPVLAALSANSPFWNGADTGYASYRTQAWGRWPTAGPVELFGSAARYHSLIAGYIASGVLLDEGMVYFDARLSRKYPTLEVRVTDVCLCAEDAVLILSLIHISEPTRRTPISYAVFCLKKKK